MFVKSAVRTNTKLHCISARRVQLWNSCKYSHQKVSNSDTFKENVKENVITGYKAVN